MPARRPDEFINGEIAQRCSVCGVVKRLSEFPFDKSKRLGRHTTCSFCNRERTRLWNLNNPEKAKAIKRAAYLKQQREHPEIKRMSAW